MKILFRKPEQLNKENQHRSSPRSSSILAQTILTLGCLGYIAVTLTFLWAAFFAPDLSRLVAENLTGDQALTQLKTMSRDQLLKLQEQQKRQLASNPTDINAIKNLAALADLLGDKTQLANLSITAAARTLHDYPSQAAALQVLLAQKDYAKALYHIDGLLRSYPERHEQLMTLLNSFAEGPDSLAPLVAILTTSPPWRGRFIAFLEQNTKQTGTSYSLLSALRSQGSAISAGELRPLLARLIAEKAYERANYIWLDFLSDIELRKTAPIFDGGFDLDIGDRFFDWTYQPLANVDLRLIPKSTGSIDRILRVSFSSGKIPFNNFYQLLRLRPGNYVFRGEEKSEKLETNSGLVWRFICVSQDPKLIGSVEPLREATSWKDFELNFTIPAEDCDTQELRLANNARAELDQQISGIAYYDNFTVQLTEDAVAPK
jgi:hypothetical protein